MLSFLLIALCINGTNPEILGEGFNAEAGAILVPPVVPFHKKTLLKLLIRSPEYKMPEITSFIGELEATLLTSKKDRSANISVWELDAIRPGNYIIGPIKLTKDDGTVLVLPALILHARELSPEETAAVMRFAPDAPLSIRHSSLLKLLISLAIITALIGVTLWLVRRAGKTGSKTGDIALPWTNAYTCLEELDNEKLPLKGEYERFYVELSTILRRYIEERFSVKAPELTTQEFLLEASRRTILSSEQQKLVAKFLYESDKVKFARHEPTLEDMEYAFVSATHFVDITIPPAPREEKSSI